MLKSKVGYSMDAVTAKLATKGMRNNKLGFLILQYYQILKK